MKEATFVKTFTECLDLSLKWSDCLLLSEVDTGEGIPDLILLRLRGKTGQEVRQVLASLPATPFLNGSGAVLAELQLRPHTLDYLVRSTGLSREHTRRAVASLCRLGWATQTKRGLFCRSHELVIPNFEITAFEFKLKDVRRAVQQAIRYRQFAHSAVVVLPEERAASLLRISNLVSGATLGSATFDASTSKVRFCVRPRIHRPRSSHAQMHVVGRLIQHMEFGDRSSQRRFPQQAEAARNRQLG